MCIRDSLQQVVVHGKYVHQRQGVPVPTGLQRLSQRDLTLELALGTEVHQDLIFNAPAGVDVYKRQGGGGAGHGEGGVDLAVLQHLRGLAEVGVDDLDVIGGHAVGFQHLIGVELRTGALIRCV